MPSRRSLMNGMKPMAVEKALTAAEACEIIRVCKDSGIRTLSFRGLRARFGSGDTPGVKIEEALPEVTLPQVGTSEQIDETVRIKLNELSREIHLAELQLTNPLELEDLIEREELTDDDSGTSEA